MDTASANMGVQADVKSAELDAACDAEFYKRHKTWSSSSTSAHLVKLGEGLVCAENKRAKSKMCRRVGDRSFQVAFHPQGQDTTDEAADMSKAPEPSNQPPTLEAPNRR